MLPTPLLRLDSFQQYRAQTHIENILSQRDHPNRSLLNQNYDIYSKKIGSAFQTQTSSHGLSQKNNEDFVPTEMFEQTQHPYQQMIQEIQLHTIIDMQNDLDWMMKQQKNGKSKSLIKDQKRDLIVNWVALVHIKYTFAQQTFHRTVNIIDRFLSLANQQVDHQLLGVTALWMAAKVQETRVKHLKSWAKLGRQFSEDKILEMEYKILQILGYNIIYPTSQMFMKEFLINYIQIDQKSEVLCMYLLQLSLMHRIYSKFNESILASASIYLCFKIRSMDIDYLDRNLSGFISSNYQQIRQCARILCRSLQISAKNPKSAMFRKFSSKKFMNIALIQLGHKEIAQFD